MLSTEELIAALNARGYRVTRRRLLEWIADGLIPHPARRGRGRGRGMLYFWEDGERVLKQAEHVCQALKWNRRVSKVIFPLFIMGYDMPLDRVRETLIAFWNTDGLLEQFKQPGDTLEDAISRMAVKHPRHLKGVGRVERAEASEVYLNIFFRADYRPSPRILRKLGITLDQRALPYLSAPVLANTLARAGDADILWARNVLHQAVWLVKQADPDYWRDVVAIFSENRDFMFNGIANLGCWFLSALIKLRLDGYASDVEDFLSFLSTRITQKRDVKEN